MKKYALLLVLSLSIVFASSCKKYLDEKSNKKLVVPSTLQDAQSLLDFYSLLNGFYPSIGEQSCDDYYSLDSYWATLSLTNQNNYTWAKEATNDLDWGYMYQLILDVNLAGETADKVGQTPANSSDWKRIKGGALFLRAGAFYQLAEYYAVPYDKTTAGQRPGIPLRLTSDINTLSVRASLTATYEQIIHDLKQAAALLPLTTTPISRPSKAAAFAALARTYLAMQEYSLAGQYADSSLQLYNTLLDYNTLNAAAANPFVRFNAEVVFQSILSGAAMLTLNNWKVDSLLYQSYAANDLRKTVFYQSNGSGTFGFKGSYDGSSSRFNGIATDEVYLMRAECKARAGDKVAAMADLNTLLLKRWKSGTFVPVTAITADDALAKILTERRKELVLRGIRWFDLRRLNTDIRFAKTLVRKLNGQFYQLPPDDNRYTQYIPNSVIVLTGMEQNVR